MPREVKIFLFRHGETDWNAEGRFQGHLDIPLNEKGREQARYLGVKLRDQALEVILASDLGRSIETARIVAREVGLSDDGVLQEAGLKEAYLGEAQGLTLDEIRERFGKDLVDRWRSNRVTDADISYPGGETGAEVMTRSITAIRNFVHGNPSFSRIGISTHGGVIRRVMRRLMEECGIPLRDAIPIPNGVVYEVKYLPESSRWQIG